MSKQLVRLWRWVLELSGLAFRVGRTRKMAEGVASVIPVGVRGDRWDREGRERGRIRGKKVGV